MRTDAFSVAAVQVRTVPGEVAANITRLRRAVARVPNTDVLVLPELCLSGYSTDPAYVATVAEATDRPGVQLDEYRRLSVARNCVVVAGMPERAGDAVYNSAVVLDAGRLLGVYRKLHLFDLEQTAFTAGDVGLPVFEARGLRIGVASCYHLRCPEGVRSLAVRDVDLVAVPTAWVRGFDHSSRRVQQVDGVLVQANLSQVPIACADQVGTPAAVPFLGRSLIAGPDGLARSGPLSAERGGACVATFTRAELQAARHRGPRINPRDDRRSDVYGDLEPS